MDIREATEADIPAIVELLKLSLGESLMPKSERYWRWKHIENPFGKSPVLLCWDNDCLIGVRAFMRWQWKQGETTYSALRAVDTATHINYQGKGIFKKLTLALVEYCKEREDHFVFNTPNEQSKPGYLKMGWEEAGKLPISITILRPFRLIKNIFIQASSSDIKNDSIGHYLSHRGLEALLSSHLSKNGSITTKVSKDYLKWRYLDVPVANYIAIGEEIGDELTGLIFGRIKKTRFGNELRITDMFATSRYSGNSILSKVKTFQHSWNIDYCTCIGITRSNSNNLFSKSTLRAPIGPVVTVRPLSLQNLNSLKNFNQWSPSLGDLELF